MLIYLLDSGKLAWFNMLWYSKQWM